MAKKPAVSKPDPTRATLVLSLVDGTRQAVPDDTPVLLRILDGTQKKLLDKAFTGSTFNIKLPFSDGPANNYIVLATSDKYEDAGTLGIRLSPERVTQASLMLLGKGAGFSFGAARWDAIRQARPGLFHLLCSGASDEAAARDRYEMLLDTHAPSGACLWNILTAARQLPIQDTNVAGFLKQIIWDATMAQDRFFAFAGRMLIDQVRDAAAQGIFQLEPNPAAFHPGASLSYKEVRFNEANLQITFHEGVKATIDGVDCVKVELDMDYFKDLGAHGLLEVLPNSVAKTFGGPGRGLSDPKEIYRLRWMAGANLFGRPDFDPPIAFI